MENISPILAHRRPPAFENRNAREHRARPGQRAVHVTRFAIAKIVLLLAVTSLTAFLGLSQYLEWQFDRFLAKNAQAEVGSLAKRFERSVKEVSDISRGAMPDDVTKRRIEKLIRLTNVFRLVIFDANGLSRFDTESRLSVTRKEALHGKNNPEAIKVALTQDLSVQTRRGDGSFETPRFYSVAYVPLTSDQAVGALKIYLNQETQAETFLSNASEVKYSLATILAVLFGFPLLAFCLRSLQVERAHAAANHMSRHDALTGLPNRLAFKAHIDRIFEAVGKGSSVALLCIDLDHFKTVNDTLGHDIGDKLLCALAARIENQLRSGDIVVRFGGNEFAVVMQNVKSSEDAGRVAERILKSCEVPFAIGDFQIVAGLSIGIAVAPQDAATQEALLKAADIALYRAKQEGRGTYRFFETGMDKALQERRALERDLKLALQLGQLKLVYQPLMSACGNEINSFEALLRWHHPKRGVVPPNDFIPLAEETGLIKEIGRWVLEQACMDARSWPERIKVAVNLSPIQVVDSKMVHEIVGALEKSGIAPHRLELEVTESVLLSDPEVALKNLTAFKELGVTIAMDDFGTGFSSLSYLHRFPFDKIKIDRAFIDQCAVSVQSWAIVSGVIALSRRLGKATTAEGVETMDQAQMLRDEGCSELQGYLFSKPVELDKALELIGSRVQAA